MVLLTKQSLLDALNCTDGFGAEFMFFSTKLILESVESQMLGFSDRRSFLKPLTRICVYPVFFLKMGFGDFVRPMTIWALLSFALIVVLSMLAGGGGDFSWVFFHLFNLCVFGVLLLIVFSTPSTYAFYGASENTVAEVMAIFSKYGVSTVDEVELLEKNIGSIEERVDSRLRFYKWLIGSFWGVYILLINFQFKFSALAGLVVGDDFFGSFLKELALVVSFTIIAVLAMIGYKRASKMLLANMKYACVEQKSLALKKSYVMRESSSADCE